MTWLDVHLDQVLAYAGFGFAGLCLVLLWPEITEALSNLRARYTRPVRRSQWAYREFSRQPVIRDQRLVARGQTGVDPALPYRANRLR